MELDFSSQAHFLVALAPEIVLCGWGIVVLLTGVSGRRGMDQRSGRRPWMALPVRDSRCRLRERMALWSHRSG